MPRPKNKSFLILILLPLLLAGCAQKQQAEPLSSSRLLLDTVCTLTLYEPADKELLEQALDLCAEYDALFSRTKEGSNIWRVNHAEGEVVPVEPSTAALVKAGLDHGVFSGGLFDITIGRLSALWDFGGSPKLPTPRELAAACATVDFTRVTVTENTVQLAEKEARLDMGGIAKGYIADRLAAFLKEHGVKSAVIDLGGNILIVGDRPGGGLWRIGVEQPFSGRSELIGVLLTAEASVVTSGIYERQFVEKGVLYHHILDPRSGLPVKSDVISATVVTQSSMVGDALSTIVILAGSEGAEALLKQAPGFIGAVLMLESGELLQYGDIDFKEL